MEQFLVEISLKILLSVFLILFLMLICLFIYIFGWYIIHIIINYKKIVKRITYKLKHGKKINFSEDILRINIEG